MKPFLSIFRVLGRYLRRHLNDYDTNQRMKHEAEDVSSLLQNAKARKITQCKSNQPHCGYTEPHIKRIYEQNPHNCGIFSLSSREYI